MNIGSRLKQILEERKISANRLAHEAGVPAQTLYAMIKRDSNKADMDIMARLLRALDMELMEFMGQDWQKSAQLPKQEPQAGAPERREEHTETKPGMPKPTGQKSKTGTAERKTEPVEPRPEPPLNPEKKRIRRRSDLEDYLL